MKVFTILLLALVSCGPIEAPKVKQPQPVYCTYVDRRKVCCIQYRSDGYTMKMEQCDRGYEQLLNPSNVFKEYR